MKQSKRIRVLLADDHAVLRKGLSALLAENDGIEIAGEAENGEEAVALAGRCRPENIVLRNIDLEIPGEGENAKPFSWPGEEKKGMYPQTNMFDPYHLPAYGLFVDKADGVRMENVKFRLRPGTTDARPAVCERK